jgi:hypothetical protein
MERKNAELPRKQAMPVTQPRLPGFDMCFANKQTVLNYQALPIKQNYVK